MKFIKAVEFLDKGLKVRRKSWNTESYIQKEGESLILNNNLESFRPAVNSFLAEDWELFQEGFNLSKRKMTGTSMCELGCDGYSEMAVREFIRALKNDMSSGLYGWLVIHDRINKFAGENFK